MPDPRCKRIFAALSEYLDGDLRAKTCKELERHLAGCQPCLAYLDTLKTTIHACRAYRVKKAPKPSARVRRALLEAISRG